MNKKKRPETRNTYLLDAIVDVDDENVRLNENQAVDGLQDELLKKVA